MPSHPHLVLRALNVRAVNVPLRLPLQTAGGVVDVAPLVLLDVVTEEGVSGSAYLFCYTRSALKPVAVMLGELEAMLVGERVAPLQITDMLARRFRLLGTSGVVGMAIAGIDMACWDAVARARNMPLVRLLGGEPRRVRAYNSCGLGLIGCERAAAEAHDLLEGGYTAIKLRLGYGDETADLDVARAVRGAIGSDVRLMVDYNQALSVAEAVRRCRALSDEAVYWLEEPTLADDYVGHAQVRARAGVPVQMGENWWGPHAMAQAIAAGACDLAMPDVMKIGGVTGWLRAAALAEAAGLPLSSHLFPEISVHLLAASPTCDWLEYVDWAAPVLREPLQVENGFARVPNRPGCGIEWDEAQVARFLA